MALTPEQRAEIDALREQRTATRRAVVEAMEALLYEPIPVLDHGFVRVIDYMGDDAAVVQAARVSYGRGTRQVSSDKGLIDYLLRHRHTSPFEMCELKLHVKLPIFVARQWIRHRTANVNEYSARYSVLDEEVYVPAAADVAMQSASNRQGRGASLDAAHAEAVRQAIAASGHDAFATYRALLNADETGAPLDPARPQVARELARTVLPLSTYSQWYWKIDLHNLLHFVALRADPHAQYEIRAYAEVLLDIVRRWVPLTAEAFENHRINAVTFSARALAVLRRMLDGEAVTLESSGLGAREWREVLAALGRA
jgi:thymidylate synthase (FAD)